MMIIKIEMTGISISESQRSNRKMQVFENQALAFHLVPRAGIEPARIAPLVFETSASTDSAIWA